MNDVKLSDVYKAKDELRKNVQKAVAKFIEQTGLGVEGRFYTESSYTMGAKRPLYMPGKVELDVRV